MINSIKAYMLLALLIGLTLFIVHPFSGEGLLSLFSTHPPMEERIRRLMDMAHGRA